ncbi:streptomycin biosynthesis protein StrG [Streptomyces antarcticus]|uniref:streptomycin biosynthesis protein StrG n=1 Tax=Streptomyces antarcticus TaxID=2996458 RepID=UPI00226F6DF1|nr:MULTISPECIES: streptomycin biosynthesis protein StrG [unclassified Streptomyces]MCY0945529.1 streptomycin biosynthesis protein StrG [Streptomyces sp. H34-AA3]MCY0950571.1 streptomycin biosynthesis protein StrG [Streptomyces sp. H27-S2]MCZ4083653.1 streptomycin biosynthesis protein StrG [Streptomyces sp. H34-S5]
MANYTRLRYDVTKIPVAELVREIMAVDDLEGLAASDVPATRETDQSTPYHRRFYDNFDVVAPVYRKLAQELLGQDTEELYLQRVPTFRVHLRNSLAVGSWHRDRDFGHDPSEVNYWVPLTRAFGNNTVWIDHEPVHAEYGEVIVFDGANSWHGNVVNDTDISRVSMDFRTLPRDRYRPNAKTSVSFGMPFLLGEYWDII